MNADRVWRYVAFFMTGFSLVAAISHYWEGSTMPSIMWAGSVMIWGIISVMQLREGGG